MPDLEFHMGAITATTHSAVPAITARLHIANADKDEAIQSVLLNCQVQLQPSGRSYNGVEEARLLDLFGERESWGRTMKPLHWMNLTVRVPPFTGETAVDLQLPCSLDFDVAANKYFYGLEAGAIAIAAMFSGTVFYTSQQGSMQIAQIPWDREARFQLPVEVWQQAIDAHYPNSAWLRLPREIFNRLYCYKVSQGIPAWDAVLDRLLNHAEQAERPGELAITEGAGR